MLPDGSVARRIVVRGRVQGVAFRAWTKAHADALHLSGWVRNRLDGSVEILAIGPQSSVEALIARCHEGPSAARVEAVDVAEAAGIAAAGFFQKPTV